MSLKSTKAQLIHVLADQENKVVALSGKWGTGKSHLWRQVKEESKDGKVNAALYVSLFGLSNIEQVKLKIVQSAIPSADQHPTWWDSTKKGWAAASKVLESFHKGFSALNEIALLAVPSILKDRVIVIDDIERKHERLSVDEVLGFVDEFTQQHGARIILILNSDELSDPDLWDTLREKVIDQEIRLDTSPAEAFDIAVSLVSSHYAERIRTTVEGCGVTNIRIISKIIRAVSRILGEQKNLSDDVLARVIPSTVLLSAIYYKGIDDGPDFDFVLNVDNRDWADWGKKEEELDEEGKRRAQWRLKLRQLGIHGSDEYERLVVDYLKSGLFDVTEVTNLIARYASAAEAMRTHGLRNQLYEHINWHHTMTDAELVAEAKLLVKLVHHLDALNLTALCDAVSELDDGKSVAEEMVDHWIEVFRQKSNHEDDGSDLLNALRRPVHPRVRAAFDAAKTTAHAKLTVVDAVRNIIERSGWGHTETAIMTSATVQDFEVAMKTLEGDGFKHFVCRCVDMCMHRRTYDSHFGTALDHFIEACRNICADPAQRRLSRTLRMLFEDAKLQAVLPPVVLAGSIGVVTQADQYASAVDAEVADDVGD
ncbi:NTPase KAP [Paraburkholderia sp. Ac-20342]|uniref:P-loop NTPase fold protein n=1 Tax=Paraburkholderia sp. Ac-20342 TaxID=2703889 RepID=UPI001981548A|nr:P-loop NTPase fold protein [Paraburkholderia sp. Ac-20342]MBN3846094.1 NTPase KAP [Paraburkholderia sp. Ac-20342]